MWNMMTQLTNIGQSQKTLLVLFVFGTSAYVGFISSNCINPEPPVRVCDNFKSINTYANYSQALKSFQMRATPKCSKPISQSGVIGKSGCNEPIIVQKKMGRLGNNICEYLALRVLQIMFKVHVAMDQQLNRIVSSHFQELKISKHYASCRNDLHPSSYESLWHKLHDNTSDGHPISNLHNRSVLVTSYPCPAEALMRFRSTLSKELLFRKSIQKSARNKIFRLLHKHNIQRKNKTLVSVHVRRTDYRKYMSSKFDRALLSSCYYKQAFHYFRLKFTNAAFIVTSDDPKWCAKNLNSTDVFILDPETNPIIDMATMAACDHHIFGLGTFGFLGAYLGQGLIVHPFTLQDKLSDLENALLCSSSEDLVAIPDLPLS